jgi:hypothetical protein
VTSPQVEDLVQRVRSALTDMTPEEQELAARVATDLATLHARQLAGDQVAAEEIGFAKAAAASLSAAAAGRVAMAFQSWVSEITTSLVRSALASAAG